jgi:hypothetical protein
MHLSVVQNISHIGLALVVTRDGFCIAGSCPAVRGTIPVSTASGCTLAMFQWWGFIALAYTNNGLFPPTCEEVWNGWLYNGRGWLEKLLGFRCLMFAINRRTPIWKSRVSSSLKFWRDGIIPLKNDRRRFGCYPSSSAFIITYLLTYLLHAAESFLKS